MKILDLFCGAGGLSSGFSNEGFKVTGVDISDKAADSFRLNKLGSFIQADLSKEIIADGFDVIMGGPPCKPWSAVNVTRRREKHHDYGLVGRFFKHVEINRPAFFLFENVPLVANDKILNSHLKRLSGKFGYSIEEEFVTYKDFGAPTRRRRLIVFGTRTGNSHDFFKLLAKHKTKNKATVRDAIGYLRNSGFGDESDHEWPRLRTIHNYLKYYKTGQFGWYVLKWREQAPSFGNVMKTYILHPDSFNGGETRAISVKEALQLMGFPRKYSFPKGEGLGVRYQMVADSVSPVFSRAAAKAMKALYDGERS
ncbi:MAG: DNA cytosine methyltransferase [Nitrososphaerota archaeon]|nr:DNA cytosine methyltransferase [Nitrososphaerota archaeon]